jgi:type I restriction and modification enzyme subunit R-like protein
MPAEESGPDCSDFYSVLYGVELDDRITLKLKLHLTRKDGTCKPEALVRLNWIVRLIRDYGYDTKQLDIEVAAGRVGRAAESPRDTVHADIVVFRDSFRKESFVVMETKAPTEKTGLRQAESYARNLGAEYLCWHNGKDSPKFFRTERFGQSSQEIGDIPRWIGKEPISAEILRRKSYLLFGMRRRCAKLSTDATS